MTTVSMRNVLSTLAVIHAVVSFTPLLNVAMAQDGPACQAGIDNDNIVLGKFRAVLQKHREAIDADDACGQAKWSGEMLTLERARLPIRNQMASDCKGFHQADGALIVDRNIEITNEVAKRIKTLEEDITSEQEDCKQAPSPGTDPDAKKDDGAFDLNSPGMLRCQRAVNQCLSSARGSYNSCTSGVCQGNVACLGKCGNEFGDRNTRCNTYGHECFKDRNHDESKLISAIGAPLP